MYQITSTFVTEENLVYQPHVLIPVYHTVVQCGKKKNSAQNVITYTFGCNCSPLHQSSLTKVADRRNLGKLQFLTLIQAIYSISPESCWWDFCCIL